jgi:hypothetical protein
MSMIVNAGEEVGNVEDFPLLDGVDHCGLARDHHLLCAGAQRLRHLHFAAELRLREHLHLDLAVGLGGDRLGEFERGELIVIARRQSMTELHHDLVLRTGRAGAYRKQDAAGDRRTKHAAQAGGGLHAFALPSHFLDTRRLTSIARQCSRCRNDALGRLFGFLVLFYKTRHPDALSRYCCNAQSSYPVHLRPPPKGIVKKSKHSHKLS